MTHAGGRERWLESLLFWMLAAAVPFAGGDSGADLAAMYLPPGPQPDSLLVDTLSGRLSGVRLPAGPNRQADSWLGVPYARPPVGAMRFRAPLPHPGWEGVLEAHTPPNSCVQVLDEFFGDFSGSTQWNANTPRSEDCLYLSVTRPHPLPERTPLAVMVWIYGGAFFSGTSTLEIYEPSVLAVEGGVIVVGVQYRVGSLGFLRLADAPGNMGLMDQALALHWVRNNIARFGGDPERITLFGNSAGAASISLHMLSPLTSPLFRRAAIQSGAATNPWATLSADEANSRAQRLADVVGCPPSPAAQALECLHQVDAATLANDEFFTSEINDFTFRPVIDGVFLPESPSSALRNGRMIGADLLAGAVSEEGNYFLMYYLPQYMNLSVTPALTRDSFRASIRELFPSLPAAARALLDHEYTDWTRPADEASLRDGLDKMLGDSQFTCGVTEVATANADQGGATYVWQLRQRAPLSAWPRWAGVLHSDEVFFQFGQALRGDREYSPEDVALTKRIIRYWTNFAKTGNPNQSGDGEQPAAEAEDWPRYDSTGQRYLVLSGDTASTERAPRARHCSFWMSLLPQISATECPATDNAPLPK